MRKIESQMCAAVQSNKNWSSGNTQVITEDNISKVYLHGNHIATIDEDSMTIFDGVGRAIQLRADWTHYVMPSVLKVKEFFRKTLSGM